ncbi:MAG: hypothetical protein WCL10_01290 [Novosphingobium sp.]|jgi:hypothetical protein|uniref:hypothetical protein n=1 Tax=Novosphingobium sp. TaxID=1874826 RepID=UPI003017B0FB
MTRMLPTPALAMALAPALMLTGCGSSSTPQAGPTASGEILPGTVSDAMLDTDRSQAEAPLAPAAHSAATKANPAATASNAASDGSAAGVGAPAGEAPNTSPPKPGTAASPKPAAR